jgi:hypothetical protein
VLKLKYEFVVKNRDSRKADEQASVVSHVIHAQTIAENRRRASAVCLLLYTLTDQGLAGGLYT